MNPMYYLSSSTINTMTYVSQDNVIAEYSFFYKAWNDHQIYHITCEEISFDIYRFTSFKQSRLLGSKLRSI
ncbi:19557_t:CDS:1, partial [Rhizophagus irregularis]